jgi:hypothetical protein
LAPKESPQEIFKLTNGYQPGELRYKSWELFDELCNDFNGLLTVETAKAPRVITFGHARAVEGQHHHLVPEKVIHGEQVDNTFDWKTQVHMATVKGWGCKVTTLSEIQSRLSQKEQLTPTVRHARVCRIVSFSKTPRISGGNGKF